MWCPADNFAKTLGFRKDRVSGSGSHEWLWMLIVVFNELVDLSLAIRHGVEGTMTDGALSESKLTLMNRR